jgi:hypothetical protein
MCREDHVKERSGVHRSRTLALVTTNDELIDDLVARAARGDEEAWSRLWDELEPWLASVIAQPRFLRRLGQREADRRNIVIDVIARMRENQFERLRLYLDARQKTPSLNLKTWLRVVAKRAGIDYARGDRSGHDARTIDERMQTVRRVLQRAAAVLHEPRLSAFELWVQGAAFERIARELELADVDAARTHVRAALMTLTRGDGND